MLLLLTALTAAAAPPPIADPLDQKREEVQKKHELLRLLSMGSGRPADALPEPYVQVDAFGAERGEGGWWQTSSAPTARLAAVVGRASFFGGDDLWSDRVPRTAELVDRAPWTAPPATDGIAVHVAVAPSPLTPGHSLVRVALSTPATASGEPAHLVLLVDVTRSMIDEGGLDLFRAGFDAVLAAMRPEDTVGIVTYGRGSRVALPPTPAAQADTIRAALRDLTLGDDIAEAGAGKTAIDLLRGIDAPGAVKRVVVVTDEDPRIFPSGAPDLAAVRAEGVQLVALGVGPDALRDPQLERWAEETGGHYHPIADAALAVRSLPGRLLGRHDTVADDVRWSVSWDAAAVGAWRALGADDPDSIELRSGDVHPFDLGVGHQVVHLFEVATNASGGALGTVSVQWREPGGAALGLHRTITSANQDDLAVHTSAAAEGLALDPTRHGPYPDALFEPGVVSAVPAPPAAFPKLRVDFLGVEELRLAAGDATSFTNLVRRNYGQLRYCYEQLWRERPGLRGRLEVEFVVTGGRVTTAAVLGNTTGVAGLGTCAVGKIKRWTFSTDSAGDGVLVFVFAPDTGGPK